VTFQSGTYVLIELGIVEHITHQGIRHIAATDPRWPFGPGRQYPYWELANATVMATPPFVVFFEERKARLEQEAAEENAGGVS
jgi:hypothetical protein